MYKHLNSSTASANSINRRISTNNPFRSALLAEEEQQRRSSEDDPTYNDWVNKNALDNISDQDDDFDVVDMYDRDSHSNALSKPKLLSVNSNSSKYVPYITLSSPSPSPSYLLTNSVYLLFCSFVIIVTQITPLQNVHSLLHRIMTQIKDIE
ncbi:unnamed protein product [[Candida] boidinii]|nr:unnamed protein product [[Candida] boidinii]